MRAQVSRATFNVSRQISTGVIGQIKKHLAGLYGQEGFPGLTSTVTDEVMPEVAEWQVRLLEAMSPIVFYFHFT